MEKKKMARGKAKFIQIATAVSICEDGSAEDTLALDEEGYVWRFDSGQQAGWNGAVHVEARPACWVRLTGRRKGVER